MYEEEGDDLPTQYQRLPAHLHTASVISVMFNKILHDYIATQHGVRNAFTSRNQNLPMPQFTGQSLPSAITISPSTPNNWLNSSMTRPVNSMRPHLSSLLPS